MSKSHCLHTMYLCDGNFSSLNQTLNHDWVAVKEFCLTSIAKESA